MQLTDLFVSQDEDEDAEREELAAGDWISVSVEIERWNLLVCQLSDLQALTSFISRLTAANQTNNQAADNRDRPELSVIGKRYIPEVWSLNPLDHPYTVTLEVTECLLINLRRPTVSVATYTLHLKLIRHGTQWPFLKQYMRFHTK